MADAPKHTLIFKGRCPDCGKREVELPSLLPLIGDDFDWMVRDFDSFRRFMLEELAARFPERARWTPADMEMVLVEVLAAVLDQLSDMLDRVAAEGYLETARRPESVRRLLQLIGYNAVSVAELEDESGENGEMKEQQLERLWRQNPVLMEVARREGPRAIHTQQRMVTLDDYSNQLETHPLVLLTHTWSEWSGSWLTIRIAAICWNNYLLDQFHEDLSVYPDDLQKLVSKFHKDRGLLEPVWDIKDPPTIRTILRPYLDSYRMLGQEVFLEDAIQVGIQMSLSIRVKDNYFQSEVRQAVEQVLGTDPGCFFEPGRFPFGEDLYASDIFQVLMSLNGVQNVCLNRFKRLGNQYPDRADTGQIVLDGLEIPICENDPAKPHRGYYLLTLHGGRVG